MRHVMSFEHENAPYQVMELETLGQVQLWFMNFSGKWVFGHSKEVPAGDRAANVANLMRLFIQGELSHETYNQLLPV